MITIIANHDGPCGLCDDRIEPGQEATLVDEEWCHADCARDEGYEVGEPDDG